MSKPVYGVIKFGDKRQFGPEVPFAASQVLYANSGRFVYNNSGVWTACANGANNVQGFTEFIGTTSSTSGGTKAAVDQSCDVWYEMPVYKTTAFTQANLDSYIGKSCDLYVSTYQYADVQSTTTDFVFKIMGGSVAHQTIYVTIRPEIQATGGVPDIAGVA